MSQSASRLEPPFPAPAAPGPASFYLNGRRCDLEFPDPRQTILDFLRLDARLAGTKEGCGEGDCGACAIIICDLDAAGSLQVRAINSCLAFAPSLDRKYVLTVEGLATGGALHPVQERMVTLHASQCGYCTPGFVMALAAFAQTDEPPDEAAIHDALAGNLCRCTGYRPIVEAARQSKAAGRGWWEAKAPQIVSALRSLGPRERAAPAERYYSPQTLHDLTAIVTRLPTARIVAGATDLGLAVSKHGLRPPALISVADVAEMREIVGHRDRLRIGAAVTLTELLRVLDPLYPGVGTLLRRFGSCQIRNLATIGGNICTASPIGDLAPVLLAFDATVHLRSARGSRDVAIAEFFKGYRQTALAPGEFLEAVTLPRVGANDRVRVYKISKRYDQDISTACAAIRFNVADGRIREARIAMGGMAATPKRAIVAETALSGRPFSAETIEGAVPALAQDYAPLDDLRGSADFRRVAAANLLRRFWLEAGGSAVPTEVMTL